MVKRKLAYPAYRQPAEVVFGTGSVRTIADPETLVDTAFMLSRQDSVAASLQRVFEKQGLALDPRQLLQKPDGEPSDDSVARGAEWLAGRTFGRLVAIGGGSVMDWARLSLAAQRGWLDTRTGKITATTTPGDRPFLTLVPTTCGSGAEAAAVAVYTIAGRKLGVVSPAFVADRVILDGQFLASLAPSVLASFLSDALSHAIEAFLSIVPNPLAKEAALTGLRIILEHADATPGACRNERLMEAGYLGGVAASNCSVGVVHAFAHVISAYGVPHGVANALGLIAGIRTNADTPAMQTLVARTGLGSVHRLVAAVRSITSAAISAELADTARQTLTDASTRQTVTTRMLGDVCVRTNPRPLSPEDVTAFLADVERMAAVV